MNQYYQDNMLFGMNPSSYLHRYAVNGKVSGNLACISKLKMPPLSYTVRAAAAFIIVVMCVAAKARFMSWNVRICATMM